MATLGLSKVFILDKYFTELQKFWETEKKLQGIYFPPLFHTISVFARLKLAPENTVSAVSFLPLLI
jgi:hypothetical protein